MPPLLLGLSFLLLVGWQVAAATSAGTYLCSSSPVNESAVCASVESVSQEMLLEIARGQASPCSLTFGQYACAQSAWLQVLQDDFLISLYSCLTPKPASAMDPEYSILFFAKHDAKKLVAALTVFSQRFSHVPLSFEWNMIFINGLWEKMLQVPDIDSPPVLSQWVHEGLQPFLVEPKVFACLHAKNVLCEAFQKIVTALNGIYSDLPVEEQRNLYTGIKHYLLQDGSNQKCYSAAVPGLNSTAWFENYLGSFLEHATVGDLQLFGDEPTLQKFARDPVNVEMISNLTLLRETAVYYTSLLTSGPGFPLLSLPDRFVCYLSPSAVSNLSSDDTLSLAQRISKNCPLNLTHRGVTGERAPSSLTREELQVASSLVRKFEHFSPAVLCALGQTAVGLSISDIENGISDKDLEASIPVLGKVRGWNTEQSSTIINKLLSSGYQILDGQSLAKLGSLVTGLNSSTLQSLSPKVILEAIKLPEFVQQVMTLPSALKMTFVEKISSSVGHPADLVKYIPDALASYIPKSLLVFGEEKPNVQDLNSKTWTREQAAMFFNDVIKTEPDFSRLSRSVLQGFKCAAANEMEAERFQELAKVMKKKNVKLGEDQLSCLVKMVTLHGIPKDLDSYPKDLLLFLSPSDYAATGSCRQYFANIGKANLHVLQRESSQRKHLLLEALACLNIPGTQVNKENAEILGRLVCDLGGEYIRSSGGNLLKQLSQCESFLPDQEEAIRSVISSGNTTFGSPVAWSAFTLNELSGLIPVFDHSIFQKIPKNALILWLKNFAHDSRLSREQLATIVEEVLPTRHKRADGCSPDKRITEMVLNSDLMPIYYTPEELHACLKNVSLENHLSQILTYAFTSQQLAVLKRNLDETYPHGYPESLFPKLGSLISFITPEDISRWNITSADSLAALLKKQPPNKQASAIIKRYIGLGNALNATALNAIGTKYVCLLNETELNTIDSNTLKLVSLNPSACSQLTKEILYDKAKRAFSDQHYLPAYYELIEPYLGGAPGVDLRALSKDNMNMKLSTFVKLRRDSLMNLTLSEVQGLLGMNLGDLHKWQNESVIREWVQMQKQSELDKLHVGLTGGTQEGYINIVTPKFQSPSSASLGTAAMMLHLLPALLISFLMTSVLS
ncbi:mesothelin [Grus americana]|nr:mesothelin [Grus americana]XP_054699634.1 mesothelin [Grus americana]XP_054699635.1 mesothelin [Grus americana]XP_054699636.1 mesothelin [Grus americana]XP_054699637.1 mesothelin [Grus americana]XP_054699639.1 mesothelin [Grus americana]XP_054699640.1 mesothelin [Grus americana]XP_054699641.1 mesothelin [Grus americana]XP_054699642.1 mesothelin [Grus americana]XP_054699643.1 mesothelin [Grus americana]XP_054699645.1 mesothelin [Grus americana]XP_054699646.1 mesothelin [Grus americana]